MPNKDRIQLDKADAVARRLHLLFLAAIREVSKDAIRLDIDSSKPFRIKDYPFFKAKVDKKLNTLTANSVSIIKQATEEQWLEAYNKNMELSKPYLKRKLLTKLQQKAYTDKNLKALSAFQNRKINGLKLSDRVWKYSNQYKGEIEMSIGVALKEGTSAEQLSRNIRQYLQEPNKLFRRVRDKYGNLHLSKVAQEYSPGKGVYRSSYKNAMRLARTEVNMAYRASDYEKYKQLDFVIGIEIKRSNRVFGCSVCESLKGEYPKSFKFVGWHPQCRCYTVPILNKMDKFIEQQKEILNGVEPKPSRQYRSLPKNFGAWYSENLDRIKRAKSVPYFLRDNRKLIDKVKTTVKKVKEKVEKYIPKFHSLQQIIEAMPTRAEADKIYRETTAKVWNSLPKKERKILYDYTRSEYDINSSFYKGKPNSNALKMKKLIDKSWVDKTVTVRRGTGISGFGGTFNFTRTETKAFISLDKDLNTLKGRKGKFQSFGSTGCAKDTGFDDKDFMLYLEVPPKKKLMYAEPFSRFGDGGGIDWDGIKPQRTFGREQEVILQQGLELEIIEAKVNKRRIDIFARIID